MAWMQSERDAERIRSLARLEDKRVAFVERLIADGIVPDRALLVEVGGGFAGLALANGALYLLSGPAPGDEDGQFRCEPIDQGSVRFEPLVIPSEGGGGMLGFGKKGGSGFKLIVDGEGGREMEFVPALHCMLDVDHGQPLTLMDAKRHRRDYNFVWDFKVMDRFALDRAALRWKELLGRR